MSALILLAGWLGSTALLVVVFGRRPWSTVSPPLRLYLSLGWALISIGILQAMVTPLRFGAFDENALWFATSGGAVALTGALNLLNLGMRLEEPGLRRVCVVANLWITLVFVALATHRGEEPPHDPVSVVLLAVGAAATVLSAGFHRLAGSGRA